jgi:F-type H+-transporting ATPase subunit a
MLSSGLRSEYIMKIFGLNITNSLLATFLVTGVIGVLAIFYYFSSKKKNNIFEILRVIIYELLKLTDLITKDRSLSKQILPITSTFFIFIVCANLLELLPGFLGSFYLKNSAGEHIPILRSPNSDLTTTLALSVFSVFSIQYFSIKFLGFKKYIRKFINIKGPIQFILGFFEMLSEGIKVLSFSFRLFGNIFAGEVLLIIVAFLVPYIIPIPFMILEVFVGIIQAFIFTILTLTFIKTSTLSNAIEEGGVKN